MLMGSLGRLAPVLALVGLLLLGACASSGREAAGVPNHDDGDPLEPINRKIWAFDLALDRLLLKPVAEAYRDHTPAAAQISVTNVLHNIKSPVILSNDLLQGDADRASATAERCVINTFLGFGGILDLAAAHGVPYHDADFGQTLGRWGVGPGPYLILPLLGPSDLRDGIGYAVDSVIDPFTIEMRAHGFAEGTYARLGVGVIAYRAKTIASIDDVERESLDFYAAIRSLYRQQRKAVVAAAWSAGAGVPTTNPDSPDAGGPTPSSPPTQDAGKVHR